LASKSLRTTTSLHSRLFLLLVHRGTTDGMAAPQQPLLHAFRHLYRAGIEAVDYARPQRYEIRDILRESFRQSHPSNFNQRRIQNTLKFLANAQRYNGFEHRILKNLLHMKFWAGRSNHARLKSNLRDSNTPAAVESRRQISHQYKATLVMLNESLDTCLAI
jgi:hypothetical protein